LIKIVNENSLTLPTEEPKEMAFKGKHSERSGIVIYDKPIEHVNYFNYIGWSI
jgi:hypothetical protein